MVVVMSDKMFPMDTFCCSAREAIFWSSICGINIVEAMNLRNCIYFWGVKCFIKRCVEPKKICFPIKPLCKCKLFLNQLENDVRKDINGLPWMTPCKVCCYDSQYTRINSWGNCGNTNCFKGVWVATMDVHFTTNFLGWWKCPSLLVLL